jgi:LysR family transcriptional regulator for bpeEF and oprC
MAHCISPGLPNKPPRGKLIILKAQTMAMDQFFCMRVFARVVELGSFARASEALDIGRASATTAVARLEKRLGVRLLHRTTRRLSLTDDGRLYYQACVTMLADLAEAEDVLSNARRSPRGRLRVSTPHSFIHLVFLSALPKFLARYPDLEVEVVMTDRAVNLVEEGIDCAIRAVDIPADSPLVARRISSLRWLTCASPSYLKARGTPASVADLERHECIRSISPSTGRTANWRFEKNGERQDFTPRGRVGVNSLEAAAAAAAYGMGIAQVTEVLVAPRLRSGELRPLLTDWAAAAPPLMVVYPSNRYLSAKVRAFGDFVAEVFPREGLWPERSLASAARARPKKASSANRR